MQVAPLSVRRDRVYAVEYTAAAAATGGRTRTYGRMKGPAACMADGPTGIQLIYIFIIHVDLSLTT
jgi:hypothetical protein